MSTSLRTWWCPQVRSREITCGCSGSDRCLARLAMARAPHVMLAPHTVPTPSRCHLSPPTVFTRALVCNCRARLVFVGRLLDHLSGSPRERASSVLPAGGLRRAYVWPQQTPRQPATYVCVGVYVYVCSNVSCCSAQLSCHLHHLPISFTSPHLTGLSDPQTLALLSHRTGLLTYMNYDGFRHVMVDAAELDTAPVGPELHMSELKESVAYSR